MGLLKNILMGGALGAIQKGHLASQHFMESPENQVRLDVMFPSNLAPQGYMATAADADDAQRIAAMHRNATKFGAYEGAKSGAAMGALASGTN